MSTKNLIIIGIATSLIGVIGAAINHNWLSAAWASASVGWGFLALVENQRFIEEQRRLRNLLSNCGPSENRTDRR